MILLILVSTAYAWWEVGHMMTAQVALNNLRPDVAEWANSLVADFNSLTDGKSNSFVEAAVWADDIKEAGTNNLDNWHFTDRPINPDGYDIILHRLLIKLTDDMINVNSINAITRIYSILTNVKTVKLRHTVFKAQSLRMLLHIVGDMHQPLHNANFYNDSYKTGDLGGNFMKIQLLNGTFINFHAFWDAGAMSFQPNDKFLLRPLSTTDRQFMVNWANDLMKQYPLSKYATLDMTNPEIWTMIGYRQAVSFAYPTINITNAYNAEYTQQAKTFCEENVVIGGYRLAAKLTQIYDKILENEKTLGLTE